MSERASSWGNKAGAEYFFLFAWWSVGVVAQGALHNRQPERPHVGVAAVKLTRDASRLIGREPPLTC